MQFLTDIPPYVILSHTWENEEITFQDIHDLKVAKSKPGFAKVQNACARARRYNFDWIWIDSCCINKESSAELSEAINSMYEYYEDAQACYVYLCDVSAEHHPRNPNSTFRDSRWFKRGWTLQELIAPLRVMFLDKDWKRIGTRRSLCDVVSAITTIPMEVFRGRDISEYSVAQRMSWAALRETTRPEDQAYCLMGLFGISMAPIYEEGGMKAFMRLQQEIIRISDDRSIFAWTASPSSHDEERGLLARSPYEFRMSGEVKASETDSVGNWSAYSFGNDGLHIHLPLESIPDDSLHISDIDSDIKSTVFLASLLCQSITDSSYMPAASSLDDVRELTVRENRFPRPIRRANSDWQLGALNGIIAYHVELLPSAQHFTCTRDTPLTRYYGPRSAFVDLDWPNPTARTTLVYESPSTGEIFAVGLVPHFDDEDRLSYFLKLSQSDSTDGALDCDPKVDTIVQQLGSGAYVSVTCELRGGLLDTSSIVELEVDYTPNGSPEINFFARALRQPDAGFMVPLQLYRRSCSIPDLTEPLQLKEIFPHDFFSQTFEDLAYVTVSNADNDGDNSPNGSGSSDYRLLTYTALGRTPSTVCVAVGLHTSGAWSNVSLPGEGHHWDLTAVSSSTIRLSPRSDTGPIAYIASRTNLQLGSYLLCLDWKER
ncbi:hypothetical protein D9758_012541 [Tetrapyrgos nigripes]|uniref:HET-domain-containing protein n=1 Tax=Tetrapyrgos nigripes TaxID=182062 RepID=A0A8H5G322_9AGAR|nr:hypothetical protein D9758_012541 [Tetrapyrgos nigripes]